MKTQLRLLFVATSLTLTACAGVGESANQVAKESLGNLGCKVSQSAMWDSFHKIAEDGGNYPASSEVRRALLKLGQEMQLSGPKFDEYVSAFAENYSTTIEGIEAGLAPTDRRTWKKALAEMEIGIRVTSVHADLQSKISNSLARLSEAEAALNQDCNGELPVETPVPPTPQPTRGTIWEQLQKSKNPEVFGGFKTLATAYQSCDVLSLPAMVSSTASVSGVKVVGNHPAGGLKREISSIANVNSSHYYIKNNRLAKSSCFEIRNSPLIYDFGGKPYTSASNPKLLDMFKNGGSGTSVLGIDCSAYVFSSLALAGLKLDPDPKKILKADLVQGVGSRAFKEPQSNGLRCLAKIQMSKTKTVEPGDIIAINGHVNMIDEVGADPFGLNRVTSAANCNSANLTIAGFDFVIAQSSPSKSGIGINRYQAKDYLKESSTMAKGMVLYAVNACKAKFGVTATLSSPNLSIVRHKRTAECKAEPLISKNQECVDSCPAL